MQSNDPMQTRPYRSRANAACVKCRERKSRCKSEPDSDKCLNCRLYGTECVFLKEGCDSAPLATTNWQGHQPQQRELSQTPGLGPRRDKIPIPVPVLSDRGPVDQTASALTIHVQVPPAESANDTGLSGRKRRRVDALPSPSLGGIIDAQLNPGPGSGSGPRPQGLISQTSPGEGSRVSQPTPTSVYDKDQDNSHIVDPANTNDTQVLTTYLSSVHGNSPGMRLSRMMPTSWSKPVMFTPVQNRTFSRGSRGGLSFEKLHIMEKMIGEHAEPLIDAFFAMANMCMPLLDRNSFVSQYHTTKDKISPALLACLYANSMIYWKSSPQLRPVKPPDHHFLWSLANDALYAELHTAPGISTIIALLLDLGGRPTTSLIANGVLLGSTVSLAHSLGLHRNPLQWDMPHAEKMLRMKIWWSILIQDTWLSFAYGTPSHIQLEQYDVPPPNASFFSGQGQPEASTDAVAVYVALTGLTSVLAHYLKYLYRIHDAADHSRAPGSIQDLELSLNQWLDALRPDMRRIITRGSDLTIPGAANLRLCYLSIRFLLCRLKLDQDRASGAADGTTLGNRYMQVQCTAEDIIIFVQELDDAQLADFWLPVSAFAFTSVTTALLRSAVETRGSSNAEGRNTSLQLAWDMILALRGHRERIGWDLGEHCLQQYSSVVEQLIEGSATGLDGLQVFQGLEGVTIEDALVFDGEFSSLWEVTPGV